MRRHLAHTLWAFLILSATPQLAGAQSSRIVGVTMFDQQHFAMLSNGDLYVRTVAVESPWTYRGNMLGARPADTVAGMAAVVSGDRWLVYVTNAGYVCTTNGSTGDCRGIDNQSLFQITGRPPDEVIIVESDGAFGITVATQGGDVFLVIPSRSWEVTYLGNVFGAPTPGAPATVGALKVLYR